MSKAASTATVASLENELAQLRQQFETFRRTQRGRELQDELQEVRAWSETVSRTLLLPKLRGFWPFSSADQTGNAYDLSGQGRTLTQNGNPVFAAGFLNPLVILDGTGDYFFRTGEAGLRITGNLTMMIWVRFDNTASATETCMSKWLYTGNQLSYRLYRSAAGAGTAEISSDGSTVTSVTGETIGATTWTHLALRFTASTELAVFVNHIKAVNTTSIPASIYSNPADLLIGGYGTGSALMTGRLCLASICAIALSDEIILGKYHLERKLFR